MQLSELMRHSDSKIFDEYEKRFLRDIRGKNWNRLSSHEKAVVTRLYSFLRGM